MKLRRFFALLVTLALCMNCVSCGTLSPAGFATDPEGSTPLLYKASDADGDVIWLFGSIHVGTDDMYPLPSYVTDAYAQSEGLAVECDIAAAEEDLTLMMTVFQDLLYLDGTTIADHIPSELYQDAKAILEENSAYAEQLDYYAPILWSSSIESLSYSNLGYDSEKGIDLHLLTLAKEEGKPIHEIESVEAQYDMLSSFSEELQIMLLQSSVESYAHPASKLMLLSLVSAWADGDERRLTTLLTTDTSSLSEEEQALYADYSSAMITDRNLLMTDFSEDALQNGDELFICVGAAHIIGDDGIAKQLQERGYTVEIVQ